MTRALITHLKNINIRKKWKVSVQANTRMSNLPALIGAESSYRSRELRSIAIYNRIHYIDIYIICLKKILKIQLLFHVSSQKKTRHGSYQVAVVLVEQLADW